MGDPYFGEFRASADPDGRRRGNGRAANAARRAGAAGALGRSVVLTHSHAGSRPALIFELYPQGGSGDGGARRDS